MSSEILCRIEIQTRLPVRSARRDDVRTGERSVAATRDRHAVAVGDQGNETGRRRVGRLGRQAQAPPRAIQSDIAAVVLPEGPGLAFRMVRSICSGQPTMTMRRQFRLNETNTRSDQGKAMAPVAKPETPGAYFYRETRDDRGVLLR